MKNILFLALVVLGWTFSFSAADDLVLHSFDAKVLTDVYYSEGVGIGDLNSDGNVDVVHGPYWFAGPEYTKKYEIYPVKAQPRQRYADNFFSWVYDFDRDGDGDVLTAGFPGTPAYVYQNPGNRGFDKHWPKHEVFDWVSNEAPHFVQFVGDDRPELVCTRDGFFGYAVINQEQPLGKWTFHKISKQIAPKRFGHGLGVGDVNGDGRLDLLTKDGWFEQPASLEGEPLWKLHRFPFAPRGGAEMYAYDIDGDGDNDVITSLAAHEFGLAWFEQEKDGDNITFRRHLIMGDKPADNPFGLVFSELHSVALADMDGDGLKDIVTGKTYWSHHTQSPLWDAGAVVYWFKLVRSKEGVQWVPYQAAEETGIGRQVVVGDVNNDKLPDIVVGGMKGAHVITHRRKMVDQPTWEAAQPKRQVPLKAGLSPDQAAGHMTVPPGFQVQLAAGEPQVHQPIAMAIDPRGRVWVAEAHTYPQRAEEGQGKDKIIILEDTTGDGRLDSRKVFIDGLNLVSGIEVGFGGVWVGAAPYLMFIPDKDGDDQPDAKPQILLDGWGYQDTHETLNSFIWGPDGWLYGCHGVFTHSLVGKPKTPENQRTPINAGVWRYHPTRHEFEVFAFGTSNPWGVDFNDHGQAFITACVIPHLWHVIQGARYHRQGGRHFNEHVYDDIKTIADHHHYAGNIRDHAWWGQEPHTPHNTLQAGGGHAHCGSMIYLGDNWPAEYRNRILMNNIHGNRVNQDVLVRRGSGFTGAHGPDLLLANDRWFRGINLKYGPDGSVYLIDWYDPNACHRRNPEIWDRTNGRVYNIAYGKPKRKRVDLTMASDLELAELHLHANEWYVRTARRLLQERWAVGEVDEEALQRLEKILVNHPETPRKLRALWTLHALEALDEDDLLEVMSHSDEYLCSWAIQLELEDRKASEAVLARFTVMAKNDASRVVRLYLASAMQRLPLSQRWPIAEALVEHDEDVQDHNLPLMIWYAVEPLVAADPSRAMALAQRSKIPVVKRYLLRRAASENDTLGAVASLLSEKKNPQEQLLILEEMLHAFEGRVDVPMPEAWKSAYEKLARSKEDSIREKADQVAVVLGDRRIFPRMRKQLINRDAAIERRRQALEILVRGRDDQAAPALQAVLTEAPLRGAAIRALAALDDPHTPAAILAQYSLLDAEQRRDAVATLTARPTYAMALLEAMKKERVPRTDLHAYNIRQLLRFENEALHDKIKKVWGEIRPASEDKQKLIVNYKSLLNGSSLNGKNRSGADRGNGRRVFNKSCASCHVLFGEGGKVGPDLTGSNRANLDYILENIVDPSAVLGKDYRMTILITDDGRVLSGLVQKETDSAITLRTLNDTLVVAKREIDERSLSPQSMMPERLLEQLKNEEIRDLIAYLASPTQVALRGPAAPIDPQTGRVPRAIEGESMKVLNKTAGQARSQKMNAFTADKWSGVDHLWWTGAAPGARLTLALPVESEGEYSVDVVLTRARDYGIVQLSLNGQQLGGPIDLYHRRHVITTGVLSYAVQHLSAGEHRLTIELLGANPQADKGYMVGLDYVRLNEMK